MHSRSFYSCLDVYVFCIVFVSLAIICVVAMITQRQLPSLFLLLPLTSDCRHVYIENNGGRGNNYSLSKSTFISNFIYYYYNHYYLFELQ